MARRFTAGEDHSPSLAAYLREIAKLPRLTVDEERTLGARIRADGDPAAVAQLVEANLRFVVSYGKRYRGFGVSFLDLIHEGNLGLIEAARRFDPARNVQFMTYAVWWVRESMMHLLADQTRAFSFPPRLFGVLYNAGDDVSLSDDAWTDGPGNNDGVPRQIGDRIAQDDVPAVDDMLIHRADLDTLSAIGSRLHLTRERVRQIESKAKDKLRRSAKLHSLLN